MKNSNLSQSKRFRGVLWFITLAGAALSITELIAGHWSVVIAGAITFCAMFALGRLARILEDRERTRIEEQRLAEETSNALADLSLHLCEAISLSIVATTVRLRMADVVNECIDLVERGRLPAKVLTDNLPPEFLAQFLQSRFEESVHYVKVDGLPQQMGLLVIHAQLAPDPDAPTVKDTLGGVTVLRTVTK